MRIPCTKLTQPRCWRCWNFGRLRRMEMRLQRAQPDVEACTLIRLSQLCYRSPQMLVQEEGLYRAKQPTASVTNTFRTAWAPSSRKSTPPRKPSPQKRAWQSIESAPHVGRRGLRRLLLHSCNRSDSPQRDGFSGCASAVELYCENSLRVDESAC